MSPDERGTAAELSRLRAEVQEDRAAIRRCLDDARDVGDRLSVLPAERPWLAITAVALHGWYTGLETIFERVARVIDRSVPAGDTWHRDLLSQALTAIPGLRPAIVPSELKLDLVELLEFRHFFRHAYGVNLDAGRLQVNLNCLRRTAPGVEEALDKFDDFVREAIGVLMA